MIFKSIVKGFFFFCVVATATIWIAWIFAALYRGFEPDKVYDSIIMGTLILLLWFMLRHNEALVEEKNEWRRRYNNLLNNIFDHISKGKDLSDLAEKEKKNNNKKSYFENLDC